MYKYILLLFFILSPFSWGVHSTKDVSDSSDSYVALYPTEEDLKDSPIIKIKQGKPLLPDSYKNLIEDLVQARSRSPDGIIKINRTPLEITRFWQHITIHKQKRIITLLAPYFFNGKHVKAVEWEFFEEYYFPSSSQYHPINTRQIEVTAWQPFAVGMKLSFEDNSFEAHLLWIELDPR